MWIKLKVQYILILIYIQQQQGSKISNDAWLLTNLNGNSPAVSDSFSLRNNKNTAIETKQWNFNYLAIGNERSEEWNKMSKFIISTMANSCVRYKLS